MRLSIRAALVAALVAAVVVPMATANAHGDRDHKPRFSALIFSKTAAFRHNECIPQGTVKIAQMGVEHGFKVDATENADAFTDANLAKYDVVIWLCTTGDVLNATQQAAFERYIRAGGGYAGIHSASDTEYDWPWYGGLVGAYFRDHPGSVNAQFQVASMDVEDRHSAATKRLPKRWTREEEWYNFRTNPRNSVHVLTSVDESTYDPRGYSVPGGSPPMGDHPISWCQPYDGGRAFYTALGHKGAYWSATEVSPRVGIRLRGSHPARPPGYRTGPGPVGPPGVSRRPPKRAGRAVTARCRGGVPAAAARTGARRRARRR
jgi:type 1 glutamine amidotransferase